MHKKRRKIRKFSDTDSDSDTDASKDPFTLLAESLRQKRKTNKSKAQAISSLYQINRLIFPDEHEQIPVQLLGQTLHKSSKSKSKYKFRRKKPSAKSSALTSQEQNVSKSSTNFPPSLAQKERLSPGRLEPVLTSLPHPHSTSQPQPNKTEAVSPTALDHEGTILRRKRRKSTSVNPPSLPGPPSSDYEGPLTDQDDSLHVEHSIDETDHKITSEYNSTTDYTTGYTTDYTTDWTTDGEYEEKGKYKHLGFAKYLNQQKLSHSLTKSFATPSRRDHTTESETDRDAKFRKLIHHNGMRKMWSSYDVGPHDLLQIKDGMGVDSIFPPSYFEKLSPVERRVEIEGQKFRVEMNETFEGSLYRAVARAATGAESNYKTTKKDILNEILVNWQDYCIEMNEVCGRNLLHTSLMTKSKLLLEKYKAHFISKKTGSPLFELRAAAKRYQFNFVLIDANCYDGQATVQNFTLKAVHDPSISLYHFMRTGILQDSWCYEFLVPLRPPVHIENGNYSLSMSDVLLIDRHQDKFRTITMRNDDPFMPRLVRKPITAFGLDQRTFLYTPTTARDLWSLLSELVFGKLFQAPQIYEVTVKRKLEESKMYHRSKLNKKRRIGRLSQQDIMSRLKAMEMSLNLSHTQRGSPVDLDHAAGIFKFSYILIGLDSNGNFFWKEGISESVEAGVQPRQLALFVKFLRNRDQYWYALQEVVESCPKDLVISPEINLFDERLATRSWKRFYHAGPCISVKSRPGGKWGPILTPVNVGKHWVARKLSVITSPKSDSKWALVLSQVKVGRKWLAKGMSRFATVTRISVLAHHVSGASRTFFNWIRRLVNLFRFNVRVHPTKDYVITEVYFRKHP